MTGVRADPPVVAPDLAVSIAPSARRRRTPRRGRTGFASTSASV